jgi:hypothetical protein
MKQRILSSLFLLLLPPTLAVAQKPGEPPAAHDAQILWEFDTGG